MIEALFSQPNYVVAKKALDAAVLRHEAIASNLANLETPGYRRLDVSPAFQRELQRACASRNAEEIAALKPSLEADPTAVPNSRDGNTVSLEKELMQLNQNTLNHALETQLLSNTLLRLKLAITGKSA